MSEQVRRLFAFPMFPVASSCQRNLTGRYPQNMLRSSPTGNCWQRIYAIFPNGVSMPTRKRASNWEKGVYEFFGDSLSKEMNE